MASMDRAFAALRAQNCKFMNYNGRPLRTVSRLAVCSNHGSTTHVCVHDSIEIIPPPSQSVGDRVQVNMTYIHNVYIRALNSIYSKATVVKPEDVNAFVGYCLTAHQAIHIHHHHEGLSIFILRALTDYLSFRDHHVSFPIKETRYE